MELLNNSYLPSERYNTFPHIAVNSRVPEEHADDLKALRGILAKHSVPDGVSIRLIHKHADTKDGEVMIFKKVNVPGGHVQVMRPIAVADAGVLQPLHYFVDDDGSLQAYEYTPDEISIPDVSGLSAFLAEFRAFVCKRNLNRKFGLKLKADRDPVATAWTEYDFPEKRGTIMIPEALPAPDFNENSFLTLTDWIKNHESEPALGCSHSQSQCSHQCSHPSEGSLAPQPEPTLGCSHSQSQCSHQCSHPSEGSLAPQPEPTLGCSHSQSQCSHQCSHPSNESLAPQSQQPSEFVLHNQRILPGTPLHEMVSAVVEVW